VCATSSISLVQRQNRLDPCQKLNFPITGFSLSLPDPGFKSHYRSGCRLSSLKHMMNNFAQHQELTWRWFCLDRYVYKFITYEKYWSCFLAWAVLIFTTLLILIGEWWRWALVSPDGVMPSRMVGVSASVNLPLHRKVQKFSSGTGSPGCSRKKGRKTVVVWWWC